MTIIEQIKAEIERRICSIENCPFVEAEFGASEKRDGKLIAYKDLLSFLSTFESEKSVLKDLEEAAKEYFENPENSWEVKDVFIAGANWQKQHDAELIEIAYNDGITIGMTKQKEQMMKGAMQMYRCYDEEHNLVGFSADYDAPGAYGNYVSIIVKED